MIEKTMKKEHGMTGKMRMKKELEIKKDEFCLFKSFLYKIAYIF